MASSRITKRGESYQARIYWYDDDGERRTRAKTFALRPDAVSWVAATEPTVTRIASTNLTVGEWVDQWLDLAKLAGRAPSTLNEHRRSIDRYAAPILGMRLDDVRPRHIDECLVAMSQLTTRRGNTMSSSTVLRFRRVLRRCFHIAIKKGMLVSNPVDGAETVADTRPKPKAWSLSELDAFFSWLATAAHGGTRHHLYAPLWLAAHTGLRHGELIALRWSDIDLDRGELSVEQNRVLGTTKAPKSTAGRRTIALDDATVNVLRPHRVEQLELKLKLGTLIGDGLVFLAPSTAPLAPWTLGQAFTRLLARARRDGVELSKISIKETRSTHTTLLAAAGANARDLADRLGHADAGSTALRHYVSTSMDRQRELLGRLAPSEAEAQ